MGLMGKDVALLEREVYSEAEASRHLGMPQSTLHYWLEGGTRGRKTYLPIIRDEATGSRIVTWGEFVEAGLLRQYRNEKVPMVQLRLFIQTLRDEMGVPYPLAHARPWISGRELLREAQDRSGLGTDYWLVASDQLVLTFPGEAFMRRVRWDERGEVVSGYRPQLEPGSPVLIDPLVRFGRPSVKGVSTEAIADEIESGASMQEAADDFGLEVADVRWAYAFEASSAA
jgi:uncharacterized protein (DUF433 family)